jgi:hypothetical protein
LDLLTWRFILEKQKNRERIPAHEVSVLWSQPDEDDKEALLSAAHGVAWYVAPECEEGARPDLQCASADAALSPSSPSCATAAARAARASPIDLLITCPRTDVKRISVNFSRNFNR